MVGFKRCPSRGTRGRRMKAGSAGFISTPTSGLLIRTSFTGHVHRKIGTSCAPTAIRRSCEKITIPPPTNSRLEWSEISVGCEACHGPGSRHLEWAGLQLPPLQKGGKGGFKSESEIPLSPPFSKGEKSSKGLSARLDERRGVTWNPLPASGNAARSRPRASEREIEVCAQCHARRGQIAEGYAAGKPFLDYYRPALLTSPLYHADGQQRDEVYIWGSFLQSKMYANGVTCSDCHDPHSGKLRAEGNQVCAACHQSGKYDAPAHHHHKPGSSGASCVGCHMPTTTYMVVDPRHDHSLRVPRPDLSLSLATPNACNGCHSRPRRALGGGAGETMVRRRGARLSTLRRRLCRGRCGRGRCSGATACDRRRRQPSCSSRGRPRSFSSVRVKPRLICSPDARAIVILCSGSRRFSRSPTPRWRRAYHWLRRCSLIR